MRFIYYDKVVISPVQPVQVKAVRCSALSGKICMEEDIIAKPVSSYRIIDIIILICVPVLTQLFRAEDQNVFIAILILFNDSQSCKRLTKAYAVCQDTSVVLFQFIDDGKDCILLEIIQHLPDLALFKASSFVRKFIF